MNFSIKLRTDTKLVVVKNLLKKRHGPMSSDGLIICNGEFQERNELHGDMKTLRELGIRGGSKDSQPTTTLYYNFKPADLDKADPILWA